MEVAEKTKTKEYMEREEKSIYTTTVNKNGPVLKEGHGVVVEDKEGRKLLDFTSQVSLLNTGYYPPRVIRAIRFVSERLHSCISADWPYVFYFEGVEISRAALAEKLIDMSKFIMPFAKRKVMFEVSGATAVNAAARIAAISYLRKKKKWNTENFAKYFLHQDIFVPSHYDPFRFSFLAFKNAFHGRHGVAKLLTDSKPVHYWGPSSSCAVGRLTVPYSGQKRSEIYSEANRIIGRLSSYAPVIAFVFEPVQGEGGINVPDPDGFIALINFLRKKGIWLIADEVQSGLGRTGKMFACEHFGIQPDMIVLSKSLGAGLPIGAVIADMDKFPDLEQGMHSGSHHCTPTACAAAIVNLEIIEDHLANAAIMGEYAGAELIKLWRKYPKIIQNVHGLGLMLGIEFCNKECRDFVIQVAKDNGLILAGCGEKTIRFYPPIIVNGDELKNGIDIFEHAIMQV